MTTTSVDDAIILPQSQGTGLSGEESVIDAAINGVLNRYVGGEYVSSEYSTGLAFQNHNASNDTVEVGPGIVFVQDNSTSTSGERGSGGNPQAESSTTSGYDTELPEGHTYAVLLPTATQISVSDSTLNEVYVDIDDVTANNSVNLEHDGSSAASPGNTSLKIGETNPDDASADTRANDDASPTYNSLTVNGTTTTDDLNAEVSNISKRFAYTDANGGQGNQTITTSTLTTISFDNLVEEDTDVLDIDLSADKITVKESGQYLIIGQVFWEDDSSWTTGDRAFVRARVNGSTPNFSLGNTRKVSDEAEEIRFIASKKLNSGDSIELVCFQDSGSDKLVTSNDRTGVKIIKVA